VVLKVNYKMIKGYNKNNSNSNNNGDGNIP